MGVSSLCMKEFKIKKATSHYMDTHVDVVKILTP